MTTFNVWTLNRISKLLELTAPEAEHNIDIVCIREYRYYHNELEIKYQVTNNRWNFVSASAWENSVNAVIRMFLSPSALKSQKSI